MDGSVGEQQVTIGVRRKRASASGDSPARGTMKDKRTPETASEGTGTTNGETTL